MADRLQFLAFGFVTPWLLAGGLALSAVPLVIHLLRRRQYVDRPWAAMQFLQAALKSQSRRVRLESMVLLAVRTLLILLAAVAVSRPFLDDDAFLSGAASGRLRVLVIDTSLSMSATGDGGSSLDRALSLAERIVEAAPAGDAFALVQIRRTLPLTVILRASRDRPAVLSQIRALTATQERGDVAGALRAVENCLRDRDRSLPVEIILICDFQATNWTATDNRPEQDVAALLSELATQAELTCVPVAAGFQQQHAVTNIIPIADASPTSSATAVEVTIDNSSSQPEVDVPIEVFIGERLSGKASLAVPAGQAAAIRVAVAALPGDERALSARIPDDGLLDDNVRWALLPERRPREVLLVSGRPRTSDRRGAADFVQLALAPEMTAGADDSIATTVIGDDGLGNADLARYDCVFLCNVPLIEEAEAARLRAYVAGGGGLVIALGDQVQPAGYRSLQTMLPGELVDIVSSDSAANEPMRLTPGDYEHPVIQPFAGNPDAGLLTTEINRYWRMTLSENSRADVLLAYSTGDPAIIDCPVESGRLFVVTTSLDDTWSNWALWPSFVPIIHELTKAAATPATTTRGPLVGDPLVLRFGPEEIGIHVQHESPSGEIAEVPLAFQPDGTSVATTFANSAGIHRLRSGDSVGVFAVNVDPDECRLVFLDRAAIADVMPEQPFRYLSDWQPTTPVLASPQSGGLSQALLLVVLGLLLVEQIMSFRFRLGTAALVLLAGAVLATTVGGRGQLAAGGLAAALLAALMLTLFVRTRWPARRSRNRAET